MPVYNERSTIHEIVAAISAVPLETIGLTREIVLVDDFSKDGTRDELKKYEGSPACACCINERNQGRARRFGRGSAPLPGISSSSRTPTWSIDPREYSKLVMPILEGRADVVFGSRFTGGESHRVLYFWHSLGNKFLTLMSNMFTDLNLTDMETCYKVFRREVLQQIYRSRRTASASSRRSPRKSPARAAASTRWASRYAGRTYDEGKKIGWKDGVRAIWCIVKYNMGAPKGQISGQSAQH